MKKGGRLDLQAEINDGTIVNIELQINNEFNIEKRTTAYSAKVMSRSIKRGTKYKDIKKIIMINILDFELFEFEEYVSKTVTVLDKHRDYEIHNDIKYYFIELPKFRKQNVDMKNKLNQWLAFIDATNKELVQMAIANNKVIEKAKIEYDYLTGDEAAQRIEELREKWEMDRISAIDYAEERGRAEGIAEGRAEGIVEGMHKRDILIAKEMLKANIEMDMISQITGLSKKQIEELK